jgi:hypothetical protein
LDPYEDSSTGALRGHTIFGVVLEGQSVVDELQDKDPQNPADEAIEADTLSTVLIVTDPSTVQSSYQMLPTPTGDEMFAALNGGVYDYISGVLRSDSGFGPVENSVGLASDIPTAVAAFSDTVKSDVEALYTNNGFAYEAKATWQINECTTSPGLLAFGVSVTDWGTATNALSVINNQTETMIAAQTDLGFTFVESGERFPQLTWNGTLHPSQLFFSRSTTDFCEIAAVDYRYIWSRGSYTITLDLIVNFEGALTLTGDDLLDVIVRDAIAPLAAITDGALFNVFYPNVMPATTEQ